MFIFIGNEGARESRLESAVAQFRLFSIFISLGGSGLICFGLQFKPRNFVWEIIVLVPDSLSFHE